MDKNITFNNGNGNGNSQKRAVPFLGSVLVSLGKVTSDQVLEALDIQRQTGERLGEILVKLGYCTEEDIAKALSVRSGYRVVSLNEVGVDIAAASLIPPEKAKKHKILPIKRENNILYVAMQNPNDIIAIDDLQLLTGYTIKPVIVSDTELTAAINNYVNTAYNVTIAAEEEEVHEEEEAGADDDKPAVNFVNQMIESAVRAGASDIHIEPQEKYLRIRFRIDGVLHEVMQAPSKMQASIISRVKVIGNMDIAERRIPQDGRATVKVEQQIIDMRIASLPSVYGERITIRMLPRNTRAITVHELGFTPENERRIIEASEKPYGFVLVTGPTGSGKSTTLYALLSRLNRIEKNIITLEDPVERRFAGINQIQLNNRAGMTFASGLRAILRSDPDIVMVGEIRDLETAKIAVEAALTGHLVFSTLHTNDAASTVTRLAEMGIEPFLIASSVICVVAQRLVRVLCPSCKKPVTYRKRELQRLIPDFPFDSGTGDDDPVTIYHAGRCISCNNTGYRGRRGVFEIMKISPRIRDMILTGRHAPEIKEVAIEEGMSTLRYDGLLKVKAGITSYEEMLRVIV
ncbi:MAG TPA: Flp pilus assembly complex ATPase component TadA [Clostridiales bacterium]|nr:Flp pilus assembly complex ATPase component TadA [Clostridiales bacterium]